jgi:hypothetical protein
MSRSRMKSVALHDREKPDIIENLPASGGSPVPSSQHPIIDSSPEPAQCNLPVMGTRDILLT